MKTLVSILYAVVVVVSSAATSHSQPGGPASGEIKVAEAPHLSPGETWTWSTHAEEFLREEEGILVFQVAPGRIRYRTKDLNLVKTVDGGRVTQLRDPHAGFLSFPLYVGKTWSHSYMNREMSGNVLRRTSYRASAFEQVTVKAGTFQAFRIEGTDQRSDRRYPIRVTLWYAPEVKVIVKFEGIDGSNSQPISGWEFELVKYSPTR